MPDAASVGVAAAAQGNYVSSFHAAAEPNPAPMWLQVMVVAGIVLPIVAVVVMVLWDWWDDLL